MTGKDDSLEAAQEAARDARTKLSETFCEIKARLQPSALAQQARDKISEEVTYLRDRAVTTTNDRPALVGLSGGAILLFLLRKPLGRIVNRIFSRDGSATKY
jgi:hypothetical protein